MENNKYGWRPKQTFEKYYLSQLKKLKDITLNYYFDNLNENSSIEEISTDFDKTLDFISRYYKNPEETIKINTQQKVDNLMKDYGLLSIKLDRFDNFNNRLLVVDINYLPSEVKNKSLEEVKELLEQTYSCKVLLLDGSRQNMQGLNSNNLPVYFV